MSRLRAGTAPRGPVLSRVSGFRGHPGPDGRCSRPQRAYCGQCSERIWGLARQGYRCVHCRLLVHKRCHVLVPLTCRRRMVSEAAPSPGPCGGGRPRGPSGSRGPEGNLPPQRRKEGVPVGGRDVAPAGTRWGGAPALLGWEDLAWGLQGPRLHWGEGTGVRGGSGKPRGALPEDAAPGCPSPPACELAGPPTCSSFLMSDPNVAEHRAVGSLHRPVWGEGTRSSNVLSDVAAENQEGARTL